MLSLAPDRAVARTYRPDALGPVAEVLAEGEAYVAMNRFHGPRGRGPLAGLNAIWLDLDVHKTQRFAGRDRGGIAHDLLAAFATAGLPEPSALIDSGRGFHAVWLIDGAPAAARPRWSDAIKALAAWAAPLGADPACVDAARVLRLPGSWNDKTGRQAAVVAGSGARHGLDALADAIFAACGRPLRAELAARKSRRAAVASKVTATEPAARHRGLSRTAFHRAVLDDLERLLDDWGGHAPEGVRMLFLHHLAVAHGWTGASGDEVAEIVRARAAQAAPGLAAREVVRCLGATLRRIDDAQRGARGADGHDPRYAYSGDRIAAELGVDRACAERLGLAQVVPAALRADRDRARRADRRRAAGVQPRVLWLAANPVSRERPWEADGVSRATWYRRLRKRRAARLAAPGGELPSSAAAFSTPIETGPSSLSGGEAPPSAAARRPVPENTDKKHLTLTFPTKTDAALSISAQS